MADTEACARVVHEALRAYARTENVVSLPPWEQCDEWMRQATIEGVRYRMLNPGAPPSALHDKWLSERQSTGWRYGEILDPVKKTHPLLLEYSKLPEVERRKDELVFSIVWAMTKALD